MSDDEIMLIEIIRNHPNPEEAMVIAIEIIRLYLEQPESFE